MRHIGIDLSKRKFSVVVLDEAGEVESRQTYAMDERGIGAFTNTLHPDDGVAFEAGGPCYYFYDLISPYVSNIKIISTTAFKVIKNSIKKTDMNDVHLIAKFLRYNELPEIYIPEKMYQHLRELLNFREKLVQMKTKNRNIVTAALEKEGVLIGRKTLDNPLHRKALRELEMSSVTRLKLICTLDRIDGLERDIHIVEQELKRIAKSNTCCRRQMVRLMQIPGIGELTAITIVSEIGGCIQRFSTKKEIASYAGLVRKTDQSGDSRKYRQVRRGRSLLKKTLTQVVLSQVGRYPSPVMDYYEYKKKEKGSGKAIVAAARKLITIIYIMLKYDRDYRFVEQNLYFQKLKKARLELVG
jgi:transposase